MDTSSQLWKDICLARTMAERPTLAARLKRKWPAERIEYLRQLLREHGR
jgi:hypothetical protein